MTQSQAVYWAIQYLSGEPLPEWAPSKAEVLEGLKRVEEAYEGRSRSEGRRKRK